jgi:hypothetical protein
VDYITLEGMDKYDKYTIKAYIKGDGNPEDSIVSEITYDIRPLIDAPVFVMSTVVGTVYDDITCVTVSTSSKFTVFFSTDGNVPDMINRSNVTIYSKPLIIVNPIIIKAVAVHGTSMSDVVEFRFDPNEVLQNIAPLPTTEFTVIIN